MRFIHFIEGERHLQVKEAAGQFLQSRFSRVTAQQQSDLCIVKNGTQPFRRVRRVEREVGGSGFEDGEQGHDHLEGAPGRKSHDERRVHGR